MASRNLTNSSAVTTPFGLLVPKYRVSWTALCSPVLQLAAGIEAHAPTAAEMAMTMVPRRAGIGYWSCRRLTFDMSGRRRLAGGSPLDGRVSEVIGPLPQIAPQKLWVPALWQGG